jgi:hypothetical protein
LVPIEGYADDTSLLPGQQLKLRVRSTGRWRVEIHRLGWYSGRGGRRVACRPRCNTDYAPVSQPAPPAPVLLDAKYASYEIVDPKWSRSDTWTVPATAASGYYVAEFLLTDGPYAGTSQAFPFIVRNTRAPAILVQTPVTTNAAYNPWGGKSLYTHNSTDGIAADKITLRRPYSRTYYDTTQGRWLDIDNVSPLTWEVQAVRFLERQGYDIGYQTDVDTDADTSSLQRARLVVTLGHDEYWTQAQRNGFDAARNAGQDMLFMGANTAYWQIRLERERTTIVAYKSAVADPVSDPKLETIKFRDPLTGRPARAECELLGIQYMGGGGNQPWTVDTAGLTSPYFAGTGFLAGDSMPRGAGYEWDSIVPGCRAGGTGAGPLTRLFWYDSPLAGEDGATTHHVSGAGGDIVALGSLQLTWKLDEWGGNSDPADPRFQRFVRNVVDRALLD